jgi:hypothetical protein
MDRRGFTATLGGQTPMLPEKHSATGRIICLWLYRRQIFIEI